MRRVRNALAAGSLIVAVCDVAAVLLGASDVAVSGICVIIACGLAGALWADGVIAGEP